MDSKTSALDALHCQHTESAPSDASDQPGALLVSMSVRRSDAVGAGSPPPMGRRNGTFARGTSRPLVYLLQELADPPASTSSSLVHRRPSTNGCGQERLDVVSTQSNSYSLSTTLDLR